MRSVEIVSNAKFASIAENAKKGLRVWRGERVPHHPSDPGDFGAGRYYTTSSARARAYAGRSGLLDHTTLRFRNPFVVAVSEAYDLAEHFGTIHGTTDQRLAAAQQMTRDIRSHGYDGFIAVHKRFGLGCHTELEIVKYD